MQGQQVPQVLTGKYSEREFTMAGLALSVPGNAWGAAVCGLSHFVFISMLRSRRCDLHLKHKEAEVRETQ